MHTMVVDKPTRHVVIASNSKPGWTWNPLHGKTCVLGTVKRDVAQSLRTARYSWAANGAQSEHAAERLARRRAARGVS